MISNLQKIQTAKKKQSIAKSQGPEQHADSTIPKQIEGKQRLPFPVHVLRRNPRLRPPVCCLLLSLLLFVAGVACLEISATRTDLTIYLTGVLLLCTGLASVAVSLIVVTTRKRKLDKQTKERRSCAEQKRQVQCKKRPEIPMDGLMLNAVKNIAFRQCDEAWNHAGAEGVSSQGIRVVVPARRCQYDVLAPNNIWQTAHG